MSSTRGTTNDNAPTLAVVGGGLAGIAAAEIAARQGYRVDLFERSKVLGGRVASLFEPVSGRWIDNGQHLTMGCCTELSDLHDRLDLKDLFHVRRSIPFAATDGKRWTLKPTPWLPASWQLLPAFLRIPFLSFANRMALASLVRKLTTAPIGTENFADWLDRQKAPAATIETFWAPLVLSALSETLENVGVEAVKKVVQDGFLAGRNAMDLSIPREPLRRIYHDAVADRFERLGIGLHLLTRIKKLHWEYQDDNVPRVTALETADGRHLEPDACIFAVPAFRLWEILEASDLETFADQLGLCRFEPGAITTLHLWFDRPLLPPERSHSTLLGGPGQFLFCHEKMPGGENCGGVYHTVVISASHRLLSDSELTARGSKTVVDRVVEQLKKTFPETFFAPGDRKPENEARLLHHRVTTFFDAVFSPTEAVFMDRPEQATPFSNLALAGDWTQTGWPATMEGAVRSGRLAVEALGEIR